MQGQIKIGFFGDSFVKGVGDPEKRGWVGRLCDSQAFEFDNFGVQGDTGNDVLEHFALQCEGQNFSHLVFSFGANDCLLNEHRRVKVNPLDRLKTAKAIMMKAVAIAPTLFISPFPLMDDPKANFRIADTARQLATVARVNRAAYIDIFEDVQQSDVWRDEALSADGTHPGAGGYQIVADMIASHPVWRDWTGQ
jgi:lysophospholipase L1-like esterase